MKKYIFFLQNIILFTFAIQINSFAQNKVMDYNLIIGKWQLIGSECDSNGICKKEQKNKFVGVLFNENGSGFMISKSKYKFFTYEFKDDNIYITIKKKTMIVRIFKLDKEILLWNHEEKKDIQQFSKLDLPAEKFKINGDYKKLVIGRWELKGIECDEDGRNCKEKKSSPVFVDFKADGTGLISEKSRTQFYTYELKANQIVISLNREKISLQIFILDKNMLFWHNQEKEETQYFIRSDIPAEILVSNTDYTQYKNALSGKWVNTGTNCNETGECETKVSKEKKQWVVFNKDGTGQINDNDKVIPITFEVKANKLYILFDKNTLILDILKMDKDIMLWYNQNKNEIQKMEKD